MYESRCTGTHRRLCSIILFFFIFNLFELYMPPGGSIPVGPRAAAAGVPWTGGIADSFAGGDGSAETPYLIATAEQLAYLAQQVNDAGQHSAYTLKFYELVADIDLGNHENWTPIGNQEGYPFKGNFNGVRHTISNMKINDPAYNTNAGVGLFGYTEGAKISNVGVTDCNINVATSAGSSSIGFLAGAIVGYFTNGSSLQNSFATGSIVVNCADNLSISAGGLVGHILDGGTITNSFANVIVNATTKSNVAYAGGLVGKTESGSFSYAINNSYANGAVQANTTDKYSNAAGLIGFGGGGLVVSNSYATGDVSIHSASGSGNHTYAGGLAGEGFGGQYSDVYATGSVTVDAPSIDGIYAGGLFGEAGDASGGSLKNGYSLGTVTANDLGGDGTRRGGLIGQLVSTIATNNFQNNYWLKDAGHNDDLNNGIGKDETGSIAQGTHAKSLDLTAFKTSGNFATWDFADTWCYTELDGNARPYLRAFFGADTNTLNLDMTGLSRGRNIKLQPDESVDIDLVATPVIPLAKASFVADENATSNLQYDLGTIRRLKITAPSYAVNWTYDYNLRLAVEGTQHYTIIPLTVEISGDTPAPAYFTSADILAVSATTNGIERFAISEDQGAKWVLSVATTGTDLSALDVSIDVYEGATVSPDGSLNLSSGAVSVDVTAPDGYTKKTYTIEAIQLTNDTTISSIKVTTNDDSKKYDAVSKDATTWEVDLPNATSDDVSVDVVLSSDKATMTASASLSSANLATPLTIKVKAADGTSVDHTLTALPLSNATAPLSVTVSAGAVVASPDTASPDQYKFVLPYGTDLSGLTVDIDLPDGATVSPDTVGTFNFSGGPVTFRVTAKDKITSADYQLSVLNAPSNIATVDGFSFTIDDKEYNFTQSGDNTYVITVSQDTDITAISLDILGLPEGATISPDITAGTIDFSNGPVTITITAEDGSTIMTYTLIVEVERGPLNQGSSDATITSIAVTTNGDGRVYSAVSTDSMTWEVRLPNATSDDASVAVSLSDDKATVLTTGLTSVNLSTPLTISVQAEDGTSVDHTLTAVPLSDATAPLSVTVSTGGVAVSTDAPLPSSPDHYQIAMPFGTSLDKLNCSIALPEGATLDKQISNPADFSDGNPKSFRIIAEDGIASADYTLSVINGPSNIVAIGGFSSTIDGTPYDAELQSDGTYLITVPYGTDISAVMLDIILPEGATIYPNITDPIDFSNGPVTFTVTAEDGTTTMTYTLTIEVESNIGGYDPSGVVAEFYVRNVPLSPMGDGDSANIHIEWKSMADDLSSSAKMRSSGSYPNPMPEVSWSVITPEGGGSWNVTATADPNNPFSAKLSVEARSGATSEAREHYMVAVHMRQGQGNTTLFEETYSRGFFVGEPFPVKITLSPEASDEIDRVNAILARTKVEIIPGNHQPRIPAHILALIIKHLKYDLVTYDAARAADDGGCEKTGEIVTTVRTGYDPGRTSSGYEETATSRSASEDKFEIYVLDDIDTIHMMEKSPDSDSLPECFECTSKYSANIELDLTKLPASADGMIAMVPMSYTVTIESDDMSDFYDPGRAWEIIENPVAHLDLIFEVLVLHKRIHEGAMTGWYTRLVRGVAQPTEAYETGMLKVWSDRTTRSLTLSLAYYVINYHGESFVVKGPLVENEPGDDIGYIILPDGLRNNTLIDPLWTNLWRGEGSTSTGEGGGGCSAGAGLAGALAAAAVLLWIARRRRA